MLGLVLAVLTLAVYAPVRRYGLVGYDDPEYIRDNPHILGGVTWEAVKWAFTTGYFSNWHPVTWLSYMLDVELYGTHAEGLHVTNLFFHIANTLLLFGLLQRMTGKLGRSAFVAGLFAVHPLHVESVAWVSERKDVLSTFFGLLAVWAYFRYALQPRVGRYVWVMVFFAMSLMAKSMLVTLPFVLLLLDVWPLGRIAIQADSSGRADFAALWSPRSGAVRLVMEKLPLLVLAIASSIVTVLVQSPEGLLAFPFDFRVANAVVSYVAYIGKTVWPVGLAAMYPFPNELAGWQVFGSLFVLLGGTLAVLWAVQRGGQRRAYLAVGWFWFVGTLVPVIGLVQVGSQAMADRYSYVPLIGLFVMVAWGVPELLAGWPGRRIALPAAAGAVICVCAVTARGQVEFWENDLALWNHALAVTSGNYVAHNNLGTTLAGQGKFDEALAHYAESLRLNPSYANAHYNIGVALDQAGRSGEAMAHYDEALRLQPAYPEAHNNLGALLQAQGRSGEALEHYREAVRLDPDYTSARINLANALVRQGNVAEAIPHYEQVLAVDPGNELVRRILEKLKSVAGTR